MSDLQRLKGLSNLVIPVAVAVPMIASLYSAESAARWYYVKAVNHMFTIQLSSVINLSQCFGYN